MLCEKTIDKNQLNHQLLTIWITRYLPRFELIQPQARSHVETSLVNAIAPSAQRVTRDRILEHLAAHCAMSGLRTQQLMADTQAPMEILEAQKVTDHIVAIYHYLMDAYMENFVFAPALGHLHTIDSFRSKKAAALKILPQFHRLMVGLEPLLQNLKTMVASSKNIRAIGFLTTQIHLSRQRILSGLNVYERLWLSPYLQLTEELLCMPWQRVCAAASQHSDSSTANRVVTKMLPQTDAIALAVYQRALRTYPNHISRQGRIQSDAVQTSSVRDLSMFQTYIWLSLLEGNLSVIEEELLPLCLLVFPCSNVRWQFVQHGIQWLAEEIYQHLTSQETLMFSSYVKPIQRLFQQSNPQEMDLEAVSSQLTMQLV